MYIKRKFDIDCPMRKIVSCLCVIVVSLSAYSGDVNIIPKPLKLVQKSGYFEINSGTTIVYNQEDIGYLGDFLNDFLRENMHSLSQTTSNGLHSRIDLLG